MSAVRYYRELLRQRPRIEAFRRAVTHTVRAGDRVLDLGAGLGTFAFFAADAGAARVWALDGTPIIHVARAIGRLNRYKGRVEFVRGWLPALTLPERADVVIFEDFPARLLDANTFRLLRWIHQRYVARGARFVPRAAAVFVAPVSSVALWEEVAALGDHEIHYGIDWSPSREYAVNMPLDATIPAGALALPAAQVGTVRFDRVPSLEDLGGRASWTLTRDAVLHGLAYWFDLELGGGERLSNAPGAQPGSWGHLFLPFEQPMTAPAGSELIASVCPHALPDGCPGWLAWQAMVEGETRRGYELAGVPASVADFAASSPDSVPKLSHSGRLEARVLELTDGARTIREIAQDVTRYRPDLTQPEAERVVVAVLRDRIDIGAAALPREHVPASEGQEDPQWEKRKRRINSVEIS